MSKIKSIISSTGIKLCYRMTEGRDPVVVFLPGYKSDMAGTKATMLSGLCRDKQQACLLFDYSGHGVSGGEFVEGTIGRWAMDAVEVVRQVLDDRRVLLVGSSMGGWVMLLAALQLGQQVSGMLGIAVAPDFTEELMWKGFSQSQKTQLQKQGVLYLPSDYDDEPYPVSYAAIVDGRENLLLNDEIDISCPARFIHGMLDMDVPWVYSLRTVNQLTAKNVQLRLLKDGDHRLSNEKQLKLIAGMLEELLSEA